MKKLLLLITLTLGLIGVSAHAATGDVAGHIYSTDIQAFINDIEVPSYNIGGRTAVVIEDILQGTKAAYDYNDYIRTLKINTLAPYYLAQGHTQNSDSIGSIVGDIYETDITTVIYDTEIPSYNIGGKTAVLIEDLGCNGEFSSLGGSYTWNENERTISLEFMYQTNGQLNILGETNTEILITANNELTEGYAEFKETFTSDMSEHFNWPEWVENPENSGAVKTFFPIMANINGRQECIGYYFRRPSAENSFTAFTYYDLEKFRLAAENASPLEGVTADEAISFYSSHKAAHIVDRIDNEAYSFIYMAGPAPYSNKYLLYIKSGGSFHDYGRDLTRTVDKGDFQGIEVSKDDQQVICHYDNDYVIDLKTGEFNAL